MAMAYSGLAVAVSLAALLLAMVALRAAGETREEAGKKSESEKRKAGGSVFEKSIADRQREAVARREQENFMNYDGTPQPPIDPDRILED